MALESENRWVKARRFIAVVQSPTGYPADHEDIEQPAPPMLHTVVLATEYDKLHAALERIAAAEDYARGLPDIASEALTPDTTPRGPEVLASGGTHAR